MAFHLDVRVDDEAIIGQRLAVSGDMLDAGMEQYRLCTPVILCKARCYMEQRCTCLRPCKGIGGDDAVVRGFHVGLRLVRETDVVILSSKEVEYALSDGNLVLKGDAASSLGCFKRINESTLVIFSSNVSSSEGPARLESRGLALKESITGMKIRMLLGQRPVDVSIQFPIDLFSNGQDVGITHMTLSFEYGTLVRRRLRADLIEWNLLCQGDNKIDSIDFLRVLEELQGVVCHE